MLFKFFIHCCYQPTTCMVAGAGRRAGCSARRLPLQPWHLPAMQRACNGPAAHRTAPQLPPTALACISTRLPNLPGPNLAHTARSLGQNFLTDERILADIVAAAAVGPGDLVIEVGPGTGNLTRFLVASGASVVAVEKDDTLIERLREEFAATPNLRLVHGDVLRTDVDSLLREMLAQTRSDADGSAAIGAGSAADPASSSSAGDTRSSEEASGAPAPRRKQRRVKVVANLPYNITTEFLQAMLPKGGLISELSIMIQEEPARRLVSNTPGKCVACGGSGVGSAWHVVASTGVYVLAV